MKNWKLCVLPLISSSTHFPDTHLYREWSWRVSAYSTAARAHRRACSSAGAVDMSPPGRAAASGRCPGAAAVRWPLPGRLHR